MTALCSQPGARGLPGGAARAAVAGAVVVMHPTTTAARGSVTTTEPLPATLLGGLLGLLLLPGGVAGAAAGRAASPAAPPGPGVHLSLGTAPGDVVVTWSTLPVSSAPASLSYGAAPAALPSTVLAASLSNLSRISVNRATIKAVAPGATVYYRVSGDSRILNFTHRTPHGRKGAATFAIFGDLGIKEQEGANWTLARLRQHHIAHDFDAILHVGDIAYDMQDNGGKTGDEFLRDWEPVASQVPYMTVPGNHERDVQNRTDPVYLNYRTRFAMPSAAAADEDPQHQPMHWSVDVGSAHIIGINTDAYYFGAAAQKAVVQRQQAWLEHDLQRAVMRRQQIPWIVVLGHQMLYSSHDSGHISQATMLRAGLEATFRRYSVDLYSISTHQPMSVHASPSGSCAAARPVRNHVRPGVVCLIRYGHRVVAGRPGTFLATSTSTSTSTVFSTRRSATPRTRCAFCADGCFDWNFPTFHLFLSK
jgi:hypothetical protein